MKYTKKEISNHNWERKGSCEGKFKFFTDLFDQFKFLFKSINSLWIEKEKRKYFQMVYLYINVYAPIHKIIMDNVPPLDGYEGLDLNSANKIIDIIDNNIDYICQELIDLRNMLYEEVFIACITSQDSYYTRFDEEGMLMKHIKENYNKLKKKLILVLRW